MTTAKVVLTYPLVEMTHIACNNPSLAAVTQLKRPIIISCVNQAHRWYNNSFSKVFIPFMVEFT